MPESILDVGDSKVSLPLVDIRGMGQETYYQEKKHLIPWGGTGQRGLLLVWWSGKSCMNTEYLGLRQNGEKNHLPAQSQHQMSELSQERAWML